MIFILDFGKKEKENNVTYRGIDPMHFYQNEIQSTGLPLLAGNIMKLIYGIQYKS